MFQNVSDEDGLFKSRFSYVEKEDANFCGVVMGKVKRYCIGEVT